ncbi:hypothetical protein PCASD_20486 [Puccinia coronata f. sp. avenae]|uniref:Secreted protein n=1 Tax=Puccinia coronata f. sp. avenae TaxID=200324 RepID=A0A2N5SJT3_9BASI|nr:hypothetical protein PCASD_20486 [Puccinia coronata f. sp. avenae]
MPYWMHVFIRLLVCLNYTSAVPSRPEIRTPDLRRRDPALSTSPSGGYAPVYIKCPPEPFVRPPFEKDNGHAKLGQGESTYVKEKAAQSIPLWQKYLENVHLESLVLMTF